jgi:ribosomal protein L6P/L9E
MAITNTLKNSKKLQQDEAFSSKQAEALAEVVEAAVSNAIERMDERFSIIYWVLGAGFGFMGIMIALLKFA